jgi:hypothetical protein
VLRQRIQFAYKLLDTSEELYARTLQAQFDAPGGPLPWARTLLDAMEKLGVKDRWVALRAALSDSRSTNAQLRAARKSFVDGAEQALLEREQREFWKTEDGALPVALGRALPHLALAYQHSHIGYLFRRPSFNPPFLVEPPNCEVACHLCHTAASDTPLHLATTCTGGPSIATQEALRSFRDRGRQLYENAVLRAVIKRPHLRLPVFRLEFLALRNIPTELQDDTEFYDEFQSSLILIYRLRARARRQQYGS